MPCDWGEIGPCFAPPAEVPEASMWLFLAVFWVAIIVVHVVQKRTTKG